MISPIGRGSNCAVKRTSPAFLLAFSIMVMASCQDGSPELATIIVKVTGRLKSSATSNTVCSTGW